MAYDKKTGTISIGKSDTPKDFERDMFAHLAHVEEQIKKDMLRTPAGLSKPSASDWKSRLAALSKQKRAILVGMAFWTAWVIYRTADSHEVLGFYLERWDDRQFYINWLGVPFLAAVAYLAYRWVSRAGQAKANPLAEFEREIQTWPADQGETALLLIKASLTGDQDQIDALYGDLTVEQLRKVKTVLEKMAV